MPETCKRAKGISSPDFRPAGLRRRRAACILKWHMDTSRKPYLAFALILGASLVLSFVIASFTFYRLRATDTITSTGSAKESVVSDQVKWTSSIMRPVKLASIKAGYAEMDSDLKAVKAFLAANGITDDMITISPVVMNEVYDQSQGADKNYNLSQTVTVQSNDVQKIDALSKNTNSLIGQGVFFSTSSLEFYYSGLPDARVGLLAQAVADAKARAEQLASAGHEKIGALKSASNGVVQVMAPNSVEVSDYGTYDTSSINKEIMVTVKATFAIR